MCHDCRMDHDTSSAMDNKVRELKSIFRLMRILKSIINFHSQKEVRFSVPE